MQPGEILDGRYTIVERLGAGGMGEVYKATHTLLGAQRVIKIIHPHISSNVDANDRFLREARAATKVQQANVATLHDFSTLPNGSHYMVWEYINGENLAQRLRARGPFGPKPALKIMIQALRGLEAIHRAGIIHRDISPENLMINRDDDTVKIIDLGVAKVEDSGEVSSTRTGIFVGKLRYAAPEQLGFLPEGEKIDHRADIYAMAMVLYELLTGRPPYEATSPHEYFMIHARPPDPKQLSLPEEMPGAGMLTLVLERALARDRNARFSSAREFAGALEEVERSLPDSANMPTMVGKFDGDSTARVTPAPNDTLHRTTQRETPTAAATLRTPIPGVPTEAGNAPTAVAASFAALPATTGPSPRGDAMPASRMRKGINPAWVIVAVLVVGIGIAAILLWPRLMNDEMPEQQQIAETTTGKPQVAEASVNVVPTATLDVTSSAPVLDTAATTTVPTATITEMTQVPPIEEQKVEAPKETPVTKPVPPTKKPKPTETQTAESNEPEVPADVEVRPISVLGQNTYIDGGGDEEQNERALAILRRELRGVRKVRVSGGAMQQEIIAALAEEAPGIVVSPVADVSIRFEGTYDRLGRGRKRRAGTGQVLKGGRVIFTYKLPDEVFRVGMSPPEAFARVLGGALNGDDE